MKKRYGYLDVLRGITLISMIVFHTVWDMVYIAGFRWKWFYGTGAYIWQQSICWTFILLSGFCYCMGKRSLKRGLQVFGAGMLVSAVTLLILPEQRIVFGVLTLLGSCMLIMIPLQKALEHIPTKAGLAGSLLFFFLSRDINLGYLGFEGFRLFRLPDILYRGGYLMTYLGFMKKGFFSTDYFSLLPWFFLFVGGYFLYRLASEKDLLDRWNGKYGELSGILPGLMKPLAFLGRHSLLIYLLHQPCIYWVTLLLAGL
ncbi:MAG: DUF1624 domain-containing protein [Roseburia sp.]|nr:DUF1624 domain-containing protein [Roseburia sp.]